MYLVFVFQALLLDESNEKALFRKGEALVAMKEFDQAREDFQQVIQLYPANKAAKAQVRHEQVEPLNHFKSQRWGGTVVVLAEVVKWIINE